jgi:hypothetical protein
MSRHGHYEIQIETFDDNSHIPGSTGECSGRTYHIRVDSKEKCKLAVERIGEYARKARATAEMQSQFAKVQKKVLSSCESPFFQTFFGALILTVRDVFVFLNPIFINPCIPVCD